MALLKSIRGEDGVTTNYHRILFLQTTTNEQNSIAVLSYVDSVSRTEQKSGTLITPYQQCVTYETSYDPDMTIASAYQYLKTLPEFAGAKDV